MTQKCIYLNFYFSVATEQLSELTGNQAIQFSVGTKVRDGNIHVTICLSPLKVLEDLHGLNFLTGGVYNDFPLE